MSAQKINRNLLRKAAAHREIFSFSDLAREFGCSRESIYFALERPSRYPVVFGKIAALVRHYEAQHKPEAVHV